MSDNKKIELGSLLVLVDDGHSYFQCLDVYFKTYGLFDVEIVNIRDFLDTPSLKAWSIIIIPGNVADMLNTGKLNDIIKRSGCIYIEEISTRLLNSLMQGVSPVQVPFPKNLSINNAELAACLNDLLSGYQSVDNIDLEAITYIAINDDENITGNFAGNDNSYFGLSIEHGNSGVNIELYDGNNKDVACLLRKGKILVATIPVMQIIIEGFFVPELKSKGYRFGGGRNREGLELTLFHILADVAKANGLPIFTVEPWPSGINHVLTLRQDYDRKVSYADWQRLLNWQEYSNLRASWYFLGATADKERIQELIQRRHEVGFHYRDIQQYAEQDTKVLKAAMGGHAKGLPGATCHGGNYRGASDVRWLDCQNFTYTEALGRCSLFPYTGLYSSEKQSENIMKQSRAVLTARHVSVDVSVSPPKADLAFLKRTQAAREKLAGHTIIMNHPDINFAEVTAAAEFCGTPGTEFWTQLEVARWWRSSHYRIFMEAEYEPGSNTVSRKIRHDAPLQPVFRLWDKVACKDIRQDEKYWRIHSLFFQDHISYSPSGSRAC